MHACARVNSRFDVTRCVCGGGLDGHDLMCVRVVPIVYTSTRVCVMVNRSVYTYKYIIHACIRMCLFICDARGSARADVDGRSIPMHERAVTHIPQSILHALEVALNYVELRANSVAAASAAAMLL